MATSITRAAAEYAGQHAAWRARRESATRRREALAAVDALMADIEEVNLAGRGAHPDPLMPARLRRFALAIGRPLPTRVSHATTGHRLHEALLDWQAVLLREVRSSRPVITAGAAATGQRERIA